MEENTKLFLGGLGSDVAEEDLQEYFSGFGNLTDCIVMRDGTTGASRRFGFVTFETSAECMNCFNAKPHSVKSGVVDVKLATPKNKQPQAKSINPDTLQKIFIGGLGHATTEETMRGYFKQFGEITDCIIMKKQERPRGFGFVTFASPVSVDNVQSQRPHTIDGQVVETKRAVPKNETGVKNCCKVFVGGIKDAVSDEDLGNYFKKFGTVTKVDQKIDKETGRKRGFAFVEFDDYDPVDKIMLGSDHVINGRIVDVKKAVPQDQVAGGQMAGGYGGFQGGDMYGGAGRGGKAPPALGGGPGAYGGHAQGYGGGAAWNGGYGAYGYGGYGSGGWDAWQQNAGGAANSWNDGSGAASAWGDGGGYPRPAGPTGAAGGHGPMRNNQMGRGANRNTPYGRGVPAASGANSGGAAAYNGASRGGSW